MSGVGGTTKRDTEIRLPRATKVKNKQPAAQQARQCRILTHRRFLYVVVCTVPLHGRKPVHFGVPGARQSSSRLTATCFLPIFYTLAMCS